MKNLITILVLGLLSLPTQAQKVVEKNIPLNANKKVVMTIKLASNIEVKTWDKKEVYIKATVDIDNGKYNDYYKLNTKTKNNTIYVESDYGNLLEKKGVEQLKKEDQGTKIIIAKKSHKTNGVNINSQYILYVPKNIELNIVSTTGNTDVKEYVGTLSTDLISGNINIDTYKGDLKLKTISGNIDVKVSDTSLTGETITGRIRLHDDLSAKIERGFVGEKVKGNFKNGTYTLDLSSVSGDINLRKQ